MKKATFMLGLPGSGKSTWISSNVNKSNCTLVSADEIRVKRSDYDPENPSANHQACVDAAENQMYTLAAVGGDIVMDGGGINNRYTARIMEAMKQAGYWTKVVFIDTPVEICVARNQARIKSGERFVPISAVIDKSYRLRKSIEQLSAIADEFETVRYFTDEHIFFDLDGTCAEYQTLPVDEYGNVNFVEYEVFRYSKPVMEVILRAERLSKEGKNIYIVSASPNSIATQEKLEWVEKHMPFVKKENIYFVGNKNFKYVFLQELIKKLKLNTCDCAVVDDDHQVLSTYRSLMINVIHPSKFLTNY